MKKSYIRSSWRKFEERQARTMAERVLRYCKGNTVETVAEWLGETPAWVSGQVEAALSVHDDYPEHKAFLRSLIVPS